MKKLLLALLVGTLLAGCGGDEREGAVESTETESAQVEKINLDDPEIRAKIIAEAIENYEQSGFTNYEGWVKETTGNGHLRALFQVKGMVYGNPEEKRDLHWNPHGQMVSWHPSGNKKSEATYKDGKQVGVAIEWHQNGNKSS